MRKHPRLKNFNYDQSGAYFVTVCVQDRKPLLSRVGRGLAPAEEAFVDLLPFGKIAEEELFNIEKRFPCISVEHYVIMPNHIHVLFCYDAEECKTGTRPTMMDAIGAFKSLVTRRCMKLQPCKKLFQDSFFEHVIRNSEDHQNHIRYINENPEKWQTDDLYTEI